VDAFPFNAKEKAQMAAALTLIRTATAQNNNEYPGIRRLRDCLSLKNITPDQQLTEAKKGLSDLRKALSFFIVPELPDSPPYGHVITLRDVRSIKATDVFPSRRAIPFHRKDDFCMYRIGRFSDRVRFGIAQKFASLFYRIGFTTEFETDQKAIPDLVAEQLFNRT
jgi:hypothetical protein